ncbi:Uncharacterised protein [Zhongshania aliphaticivorans]|uniref:Uncharacterized protein n=1 Tax=Zhongshania aliphaticivorans TaxID=1470434 RepID=A0A5S9N032_9GAMM|nr:hypothetical protein [Zhongshania aliphaticivorans]CAA0082089.1 Uncharacterised protein [Zhongshania aliphaticivorans]CAA0084584.1 Uncharacterised protein [Zhongshania aliphaticivorans]
MISKRYAFTAMSSGLYLFKWLILLFEDVDELMGRKKYNIKVITRIIAFSLFVYISLLVSSFWFFFNESEFFSSIEIAKILLYMSLLLFFSLALLLVVIYRDVLVIQSKKINITGILLIVGLTFFFYSSFPYVQEEINDLKYPRDEISKR